MTATPIKRLRGRTAFARFLAECGDGSIGEIARPDGIPSPYDSGPTWAVEEWQGRRVFIVETSHTRYDVFEVPAGAILLQSEEC